jgi:tripartite-type tricarboxylate transporter receptor subunit TctC
MNNRFACLASQFICTFAVVTAMVSASLADPYPTQPVKIVIQAAAGNGPDVLARIVADRLSELWGQQVLVINRPGAGGIIAGQAAAAATPDGYTLYMPSSSTFVVLPTTHPKLPFNLERDFVPIGLIGQQPMVIAAAPSLGVGSLQELIAQAKGRPGEILYAALNRGTLPHLTSELFRRHAATNLTYIPYPGTSQALNDIKGGRVSVIFDSLPALFGALDAGTVKALAVAAATRLPILPDVPTVSETLPGFLALSWFPLLAPTGTSDQIVRKVSADLRTVLNHPKLRERFETFGTSVRPMSPDELSEFIRNEQQRWSPVVSALPVNPQ